MSINVVTDSKGEYFDLQVGPDVELDALVRDLQAGERHLLLMIRDTSEARRSGGRVPPELFLCGHDERHWFVAGVPRGASSVREAKEALKPRPARESQSLRGVKPKDRDKRRNPGFVRQGEWFFVPRPDIEPRESVVLHDEPISREGGRPHIVEMLFRRGGERVYVSQQYPQGLTEARYHQLVKQQPEKKKLGWRIMIRNPEAYAKGRVRHPDHKTVVLQCWHQIVPNSEVRDGMVTLAFLD